MGAFGVNTHKRLIIEWKNDGFIVKVMNLY